MCTVGEFANEYNLSVETVLNLCKNLNINVKNSSDMLSEKDVELLTELLDEVAFSHQGDDSSNEDENQGESGGGTGGQNDVDIDREALISGRKKLGDLGTELTALQTMLDGIVVIPPVPNLIPSCKSILKDAIDLQVTLSTNAKNVAKCIYNDDKMFELLFGEDGLAYQYGLDNIGELMIEFANNENLSKDKIDSLKFRDELLKKISAGEYTYDDEHGYSRYDDEAIQQLILSGGYNSYMFGDLISGMKSHNNKMDKLSKKNEKVDKEASSQKRDTNSTASNIGMGLASGKYDIIDGELYEVLANGERGRRIVVDGSSESEGLNVIYKDVKDEDGNVIDTITIYTDTNDKEVFVLEAGNNTIYGVDSENLPSNVKFENFRNNFELSGFETAKQYLAKKGLLVDASMGTVEVDTNGIDYVLGVGQLAGKFEVDEKTGDYYLKDGHIRIVVDGSENLTKGMGSYTSFVNGVEFTVDFYIDEKGNKVAVIDKNSAVNVSTLNNQYEFAFVSNANNYLMSELGVEEPYIPIDTNVALDYLKRNNINFRWDIESKKYVYDNGVEIFPKDKDGKYVIEGADNVAKITEFYNALFQDKNIEYSNAMTDSYNLLYNFLSSINKETFNDTTIIGGYYISDKVKNLDGSGMRLYATFDEMKKLSSTELASFEKISAIDAAKQVGLEEQFRELFASTNGTFSGEAAEKFIEELKTKTSDVSGVKSEYLKLLGFYKDTYSEANLALGAYQDALVTCYSSNDRNRILNSQVDNVKLKSDLDNVLSGYKYASNDSTGKSGDVAGRPVLKVANANDMRVIYAAIANGTVKVSGDGLIYYEKDNVYITIENDGIDIQTWNEFSKVLTTSNSEEIVNLETNTDFVSNLINNLSNGIKKFVFSTPELNVDDCKGLDSNEVQRVVDGIKESASIASLDSTGGTTFRVNADQAKYIVGSILSGSNEFSVDGTRVSFVNSETGKTIYVTSVGNCMENALRDAKSTDSVNSYLTSDFISKYYTNYNYLTDINYAYNTLNADEFVKFINNPEFANTLNSRAVSVKEGFDKQFADKFSEIASVASVPLGLLEGARTFAYATDKAFNVSNTTPIYSVNTYSSADVMRGQVVSNIANSGSEYAEFESLFYSTTMSMADNMFNTAVFGPSAMGVGLALSSFDNSYNDAINRGINQQNAFNYALALAVLEGATEQMSWDKLGKITGSNLSDDVVMNAINNKWATIFKGKSGESLYSIAKIVTGIGSQAGSEGFEELVSSVGGRWIDNALNGDKSAQFLRYQELVSQGVTSEKAVEMIALENLDEDLQSVVSGMMSGGMMSTNGVIINNTSADGQFRNALEYNLANGNYDASFQHISDYLSDNSKSVLSDAQFKSDLETAFVNKDYSSVINQILNNSKISLDVKNNATSIIINTFSSTNQIDEIIANDLLSKVEEHNKKVQEEFKKVQEEHHNRMKEKLKEKGINPRNMSLETMIKKYPDVYKEVVESYNKESVVADKRTDSSNNEEIIDSNVAKLSSLVDGHYKLSVEDGMVNLEGKDIVYRFSKDNVNDIIKKYEGKNLDDSSVLEHFENDLKSIPDVDVTHIGEIVETEGVKDKVVKTSVAGALGAGVVSGMVSGGNTGSDGNVNSGSYVEGNIISNSSGIKSEGVSSNSTTGNTTNTSDTTTVNNDETKSTKLSKKDFIAKYLSTEVKTNFANFLKTLVNNSKRKNFNISKLNNLIENFNSLIDSYCYYLSEQIKHDISLNSDNVDSSNLNLYNNLITDLMKIFESNKEFFEQLNSNFDENLSELISNMDNLFLSIRILYNKNAKKLQGNLKGLKDNLSVKINNLFNKISKLLNSYNQLFDNYGNNDVIDSVDIESMKDDIDKIISFHNSRYPDSNDALNRLKLFSDSKSSGYGNYNLITSSNGARELLMKYTPEQIAEYLFNLEQVESSTVEDSFVVEEKNTGLSVIEYMTLVSKNQIYDNFKGIISRFIDGKLNSRTRLYDILVNYNSIKKSIPSKSVYDRFKNRFLSILDGGKYIIRDQGYYFTHVKFKVTSSNFYVNHRLYINAEFEHTFKFLELFADKCEELGLPFYFKTGYFEYNDGKTIVMPLTLKRSESAVIYASDELIQKYTEICKQIKMENPDLEFYSPPVACASIDGWLGYGMEPNEFICEEKEVDRSFNSVRERIIDEAINKGVNDFINRFGDVVFSENKTVNDLLIDSLYKFIVDSYGIIDESQLHNLRQELELNRDNYLEQLKYDNIYLKVGTYHSISSVMVKMNFCNEYLKENPDFYNLTMNAMRVISVEYGVNPDNFALNTQPGVEYDLREQVYVSDSLSSNESEVSELTPSDRFIKKYSYFDFNSDFDSVEFVNDFIASGMSLSQIFEISSIRERFSGLSFDGIFNGMTNEQIVDVILDERNISFVKSNVNNLNFIVRLINDCQSNEKAITLLKLFNSKDSNLISMLSLESNFDNIVASIYDKNLLLDIFSSLLLKSEQLRLFEKMSLENIEYIVSHNPLRYGMEKYYFYFSLRNELNLENNKDSLLAFLSFETRNIEFLKMFELKFSKLDMTKKENIKILQEYVLNANISLSILISNNLFYNLLSDGKFISQFIIGLDSKIIANFLLNININNDSLIINNIIENINSDILVGILNEFESFGNVGYIHYFVNQLTMEQLKSVMVNPKLDFGTRQSIIALLSFYKISYLTSNEIIGFDALIYDSIIISSISGNSLTFKDIFEIFSSEDMIIQFLDAIRNNQVFNFKYTNAELLYGLAKVLIEFKNNRFYLTFNDSGIKTFYEDVVRSNFGIEYINNLIDSLSRKSDLYSLFPNGVIEVNALGEKNKSSSKSISIDELLDLLKTDYEFYIQFSIRSRGDNYNVYRAAFNELYQAIKRNNFESSVLTTKMLKLLGEISEEYNRDKKEMFDKVDKLKGNENITYYEIVDDNGIVYKVPVGYDNEKAKKAIENINSEINKMPSKLKNSVKLITLNNFRYHADIYWEFVYDSFGFCSAANAGDGVINIYAAVLDNFVNGYNINEMLYHEVGHNLDHVLGRISESQQWRDAIKADNSYVSDYARKSLSEDFAESVSHYFLDKEQFVKNHRNRARVIAEIFSEDIEYSLNDKVNDQLSKLDDDTAWVEDEDFGIDDEDNITDLSDVVEEVEIIQNSSNEMSVYPIFGGNRNIEYLSSDTINSLSIQERQNAERFLRKDISSVTVNEYKRYGLVVDTANKILETAPEGYFKDDKTREEFLFGKGNIYENSRFVEILKKNKGILVDAIAEYCGNDDIERIREIGFYNIIDAINVFAMERLGLDETGINLESDELLIKKIAAVNPEFYDGADVVISNLLEGKLKSAKNNNLVVESDLSKIVDTLGVELKNRYVRDKYGFIDHSLKSEKRSVEKVYSDWYNKLVEYGYRIIKIDDKIYFTRKNYTGKFTLDDDGNLIDVDTNTLVTDDKGNIINLSFDKFIPKDLLRFTIIADEGNYTDTVVNTIRMLEQEGYKVEKAKLDWPNKDNKFYQGVNLTLNRDGQVFELQLHTDYSFYAKDDGTHLFYEVKRNDSFKISDDKKILSPIQKVSNYAQYLVQGQVIVPTNAHKLYDCKSEVESLINQGKPIGDYLFEKVNEESTSTNAEQYVDDSFVESDIIFDESNIDIQEEVVEIQDPTDNSLSSVLDQGMEYNEEEDSQIGNEYAIEIDGYKVFSKDFATSIRQMGNHFGDAGVNNQELGKKINEMFLQGKTASMIVSLLEGNERVEFENYLNNTIEGRFLSKITDSNLIKAVSIYTRIGYNNINSALRTGNMDGSIKYTNPLTKEKESILVKDLIESIDKVISLYGGLDSDTVLYRAVGLDAFIEQNEMYRKAFESIQDKSDVGEVYGVLSNFVGFKFSDKGYMSTSPGYNTSFAKKAYPIVLEILAPQGTSGAYLNQISKQYNVENEFLLDNGTTLKIVDVKLYDDMGDYNAYDRVVVRCEVVSDDAKVKVEESIVEPMMEYPDMVMDNGDTESDLEYISEDIFYEDEEKAYKLLDNLIDEGKITRGKLSLYAEFGRINWIPSEYREMISNIDRSIIKDYVRDTRGLKIDLQYFGGSSKSVKILDETKKLKL